MKGIGEKLAPRFTDSDIIYGPANEIIYKIIINMNVQVPGKSKVSWLPPNLNNRLTEMVDDYNEANVINRQDYNSDSINNGFEESSNYQGVKIDFDGDYDYISDDLVNNSDSFGNSEPSIDELFETKNINLNNLKNNHPTYDTVSNNESSDNIKESATTVARINDLAEEDDI